MHVRATPTALPGNERGMADRSPTPPRRARVAGALVGWFVVMAVLFLWILAVPPRGAGDDLAELQVRRHQSTPLNPALRESRRAAAETVPPDLVCNRVSPCSSVRSLPVSRSCTVEDVLREQYQLSAPPLKSLVVSPHCASPKVPQRNGDEGAASGEPLGQPSSLRGDMSFSTEWFFEAELETLRPSSSLPTSAATTATSLPHVGVRLLIGRRHASQRDCDAYRIAASKHVFTNDEAVQRLARGNMFGPDWFEASVIVKASAQHGIREHAYKDAEGGAVPLLFAWQSEECRYISTTAASVELGSSDTREMVFLVDHVHTQWNALNELAEEAHFDYVLRRLHYNHGHSEDTAPRRRQLFSFGSGASSLIEWSVTWHKDLDVWMGRLRSVPVTDAAVSGAVLTTPCVLPSRGPLYTSRHLPQHTAGGRWVTTGDDPIRRYDASYLKGYWLTYKTMNHKSYDLVPNYHYDYLGRMNFGTTFSWRHPSATLTCRGDDANAPQHAPRSTCATRECILDSLRNRVLYFIGDSHMRIFFYGFLSRLGIAYPLDKVWRGDRTDVVPSHNVTIHFVASYFLNLSKPSAEKMLHDASHPFVVAGVGQHHSCHCWTAQKHSAVVDEALATLLPRMDEGDDEAAAAHGSGQRQRRDVAWFGIPAQPYNTHLYRKRPVGQSRRDCRNNARHLVYSANDHRSIAAAADRIDMRRPVWYGGTELEAHVLPDAPRKPQKRRRRRRRGVWYVDALQLSLGMQHTSLDGAHYYTWVREAWIDTLADALYQAQLLRSNSLA